MRVCKKCNEEKEDNKFAVKQSSKGRSYRCWTCYSCQYKITSSKFTEETKEKARLYAKQWSKDRVGWCRYKAYRHGDKLRNSESLNWEQFQEATTSPCFYCGLEGITGLDRIDNSKGHCVDNVRSCCEQCNNILGDLPDSAKLCLASGLAEARQKGYLSEWIIPTKRKHKVQK